MTYERVGNRRSNWFKWLYRIDRKAYYWIKENKPHAMYCESLRGSFLWTETPQGARYWHSLESILRHAEELNKLRHHLTYQRIK